jgi:NapC/NirT cytochrome c family, N-terminal region/Cytochrome c3
MRLFDWVKEKVSATRERLKEPIALKAKLLILALIAVIVFGGGFVAYKFYDFTQNNPKFCVGCHLMQPAYDSWAKSEHKTLNCHECHHLTIPEQNQLLISFVLHRPNAVPERHKGQIIVSSKYCNECHTEKGKAERINKSLFHAKHVYMEQIECTECHGEVKPDKSGLHHFLPTEKFCTKCHKGKQVHGEGMGGLACINCHTDRTKDLKPGRLKCLYCHSTDENIRTQLKDDATMDVRFFAPDSSVIKKAKKIQFSEASPMQFYCYECHKPHTAGKVKPKNEDCLRCHQGTPKIGKHKIHLNMDMQCKDCHKPHMWRVTEASAKKDCVSCHEYRSPQAFM